VLENGKQTAPDFSAWPPEGDGERRYTGDDPEPSRGARPRDTVVLAPIRSSGGAVSVTAGGHESPTPAQRRAWTIDRAESLLNSLTGVVSVRVVAKPGGRIEEIHVLTTEEVSPKQTVRNVESALFAHFDLEVDHRKISVAQTSEYAPATAEPPWSEAEPRPREPQAPPAPEKPRERREQPTLVQPLPSSVGTRILFDGHQVESKRASRVRMRVAVEWEGERFTGDAEGPDLPRPRMETIAAAALKAIEAAVRPGLEGRNAATFALDLDGVEEIEAFGRPYVLVAVHALHGRDVTPLAGTSPIGESRDRAVILATLQATDRWVRGHA